MVSRSHLCATRLRSGGLQLLPALDDEQVSSGDCGQRRLLRFAQNCDQTFVPNV